MMNRFAGYADNGGMPFEKSTKPKSSRFAGYAGVDEEGFIPNFKRENNMTDYDYDTSRGPWHAMIDKQALAIQSQIGCSYAQAFTKAFTDPRNSEIVAAYKSDDLAKAYDAYDGGQRSMSNASADIHKRVDELTLEKQARDRAEITGETYAAAYTAIYTAPENIALRKAAPPARDPIGPAESALNDLVASYMAAHPKSTREMAFTAIYVDAANAPLKRRYDAEVAAKPFSPYSSPSHAGEASNRGFSGAKPRGYIGG
jgi:hypothetical protein